MKLLTKTQAKELYEVVLRLHNIASLGAPKQTFSVDVPSMFELGTYVLFEVHGNNIGLYHYRYHSEIVEIGEWYENWSEFEGAYEL